MKIPTPEQIRQIDQYTIQHEPISSIDLMERAAAAFVSWFIQRFPNSERTPVRVLCGPGNNGGDGLAVARLLNRKYFGVEVYVLDIGSNRSEDFKKNLKRIPTRRGLPVFTIRAGDALPEFAPQAVLIDAVFGSGLNRPVTGYWADLFQKINDLPNTVVAIDTPSGLFAEQPTDSTVLAADYTLSFQFPKRAFLYAENQAYVGHTFVQPIGLHPDGIARAETPHRLITGKNIAGRLRTRKKHDHKGDFGRATILAGGHGKMGAAVLATRACLRAGTGLVHVHVPGCGYQILQTSCPEAMTTVSADERQLTDLPHLENMDAVGIGCGIGQSEATQSVLIDLLESYRRPLVLDADALNIVAKHPNRWSAIPPGSILTPHPKEFERLFGTTTDNFARNDLQRHQARELQCVILLKGANTAVATPDGRCYYNSTGNPGMATGGSGDVLTGLLTGLLAQGYSSEDAALIGVYLHGLAGDLAAEASSQEAMLAGDLVDYFGVAFQRLST